MRIVKLVGLVSVAAASLTAQAALTTPGKSNGSATVGGFARDIRILVLQGRVTLDDGKTPESTIMIERVCGTFVYREGFTNRRGEYSIQLGQNSGIILDASASAGTLNSGNTSQGLTSDVSPNAMWDCELRAALPGYRSDVVMLSTQRNADSPVINLVLHYMGDSKGAITSATSELAPKDAKKAYQKSLDAAKSGNPDEAQKALLKAVELYPRYAVAWFDLGQLYEQRGHPAEAKDAYNHAIAGDANYANPYEKLYLMAVKETNWPLVGDLTGKLLGLDPYDFPGAYYYNALANFQADKLDAAERSGREAVKVSGPKADLRAHYVLGLILGRKGDSAGALAELREFLRVAPSASNRAQVEKFIADLEQDVAQAKIGPAKQ